MNNILSSILIQHSPIFYPLISLKLPNEIIAEINLSDTEPTLSSKIIADVPLFTEWIAQQLASKGATYGIGGYCENRNIYAPYAAFCTHTARTLHLGVDIWGAAGTPVYAPIGGMIHSYAYNDANGDYGVTIILQHNIDTTAFYTLYGHLSQGDLAAYRVGKFITRGEVIGHFGNPTENGNWPPHLHFQIIEDIGQYEGDYPGVCALAEKEKFVSNSPDATLMINF